MKTIVNKVGEQICLTIKGRLDTPNYKAFEGNIQPIPQDMRLDVCNEVFDMTGFSAIFNITLCYI